MTESLRLDYRVACMLCGRGSWGRWAKEEVPRILPSCRHCGGWQLVDYDIGVRGPGMIDQRLTGAA